MGMFGLSVYNELHFNGIPGMLGSFSTSRTKHATGLETKHDKAEIWSTYPDDRKHAQGVHLHNDYFRPLLSCCLNLGGSSHSRNDTISDD